MDLPPDDFASKPGLDDQSDADSGASQSNGGNEPTINGMTFVDRWERRIPASANPFATFGFHLIWLMLDVIADYDTVNRRQRSADASSTQPPPSPELAAFLRVVNAVRSAKSIDLSNPRDWVLTENLIEQCRPLFETQPLGLFFASSFVTEFEDHRVELSMPFLRGLVDKTRKRACPPLEPSDLSDWVEMSAQFRSMLKSPLELSELLDVLESWLRESDRLAGLITSEFSAPRPLFRELPEDLTPVAEELLSSFKRRGTKSRSFTEADALVVLEFLREDIRHRSAPTAEVKKEIAERIDRYRKEGVCVVSPSHERLDNLFKELFQRGYAEIGVKHGQPDNDVIHQISRSSRSSA